jgi:serine/threonine-protein kinase
MDLREQLQSTIGPAYRIDRELSGGAMSRVFVARDASLGRDVVIKLLSPELAGSLSTERFRREIELSARLQHPNIVPLLTAGDADSLPFYTMPLVAGESLRARLSRDGALPIRQALTLLRDVARALAYAHRHGVVHRDIKPDNILVTSDYAVVTDFGIAKAIADAARDDTPALTALGVSLGSPAYMAPEQIAADPNVDARADIYAFGALAYEVLTGSLTFSGRNAQAVLAAHMTEAPDAIATRRDGIPPTIAALVMRCLEKQASARPQSADDIIAILTAVVESDSAPAREARRSRSAWIAAATVVGMIAIAGALTVRARRADSKPLNRRLIAVVPFRVTATDSSVRSLRDGMLDLISAKLTGATRTVDSRTLLGAWRRRGGTASTDLSEARAVDLAKELGAGQVLQGEIVQTGDTLTVTGSLIDASAVRKPATTSVRGSTSAIAALVDTMVGKLLVLGAGERRPDALASIPLPALQAFLEGQDAYRAGHYQAASDAFARALEIDSTFALAGVRLSLAAEWSFDRRAPAGRAIAFRYHDRLSERDQLILGPPANPVHPRSAADLYAYAEQAVQTAPDVPELWHRVADLLFHFGDAMGVPDAWRRSIAGFERALKLDPAFTPAREHLPNLYASLGDTAAALRSLEGRDSSGLETVVRFIITPDPKQLPVLMRELQRHSLGEMRVADVIASGGPYVDYSDSLLAAAESRVVTSAERATLARVTRDVALTRGQPKRAAIALRETKAPIGTQVLDALLGDGDSVAAAAVIPPLTAAVRSAPTVAERDAWLTNAFALSQHAIALGALTDAKALVGEFRALAVDTTRPARRAKHFAMIVDAQVAVLEKQSDARARTERLDSLLRRVEVGDYAGRGGNLIVSRLWERLGEPRRAYDATKRIQWNGGLPPYLMTYARERARLAAIVGEREDAIKSYRTYVSVRSKPEPAMAADVARAKQELARLEKLNPKG